MAANDELGSEDIDTRIRRTMVLNDEVVPPRYTSSYTNYCRRNGAKVDVTHGCRFFGCQTSCMEAVVLVDVGILTIVRTDVKVYF